MSRAFTREVDDAPVAGLPDRATGTPPFKVTPNGAKQISARIEEIDRALKDAENPAETEMLSRDLRYWVARHAGMEIVPRPDHPDVFTFGVTGTIKRRGRTMKIAIVGEDEAEPSKGLVAYTAPLARALEGAGEGELIEFEAGGKTEQIKVLKIG